MIVTENAKFDKTSKLFSPKSAKLHHDRKINSNNAILK